MTKGRTSHRTAAVTTMIIIVQSFLIVKISARARVISPLKVQVKCSIAVGNVELKHR